MIRRHGTSTPPWSSTSPSTSSCRWFLARRWCTPTTSSSSRCPTHKAFRWWFPKNAFDGTFQDGYFDGYDPYTNPSAASGFTSAAFRWKKSVFFSSAQLCVEERRVRPTVELAGESKRCFLWPRNIVNFAKVGINMTVKTSKFFFCKKIFQSLLQVWAFASPVDYWEVVENPQVRHTFSHSATVASQIIQCNWNI